MSKKKPTKPSNQPEVKTVVGMAEATRRVGKRLTRIQQAVIINRRQAYAYASEIGQKRVIRELDSVRKLLLKKLNALPPHLRDGSFTETSLRATLAQIEDAVRSLTVKIEAPLIESMNAAALLGRDDTLAVLGAMDKEFRGVVATIRLAPARKLNHLAIGKRASVLRRLATDMPTEKVGQGILQRYGMGVVKHFEEELRKGLISGSTFKEMRTAITNKSAWLQSTPTHWAQRIVRTETMGAYNRASLGSAEEVQTKIAKKMVKVLSATFDDRTAWDSYQVHGEVRYLEDPFEWRDKHGRLWRYEAPPNRPNDREVVIYLPNIEAIPPELKPLPLSEYHARFAKQVKHGSPPKRPRMMP